MLYLPRRIITIDYQKRVHNDLHVISLAGFNFETWHRRKSDTTPQERVVARSRTQPGSVSTTPSVLKQNAVFEKLWITKVTRNEIKGRSEIFSSLMRSFAYERMSQTHCVITTLLILHIFSPGLSLFYCVLHFQAFPWEGFHIS